MAYRQVPRARTRTRPTRGSGATAPRCETLLDPPRPGEELAGERHPARRVRGAAVAADAARRTGGRCDGAVRSARAAADRQVDDGARGQRGHGQDVHPRRLVTRYLAEGVATLDEMLLDHLRPRGQPGAARAGPRPAPSMPRSALDDPADVGRRDRRASARPAAPDEARGQTRHRLRDALADFDAATIATTHQFCSAGAELPWHRRRHRRRRHAGRGPRRRSWPRSSTTSTSRGSATTGTSPRSPARWRSAARPRGRGKPAAPSCARRTRIRIRNRRCG